MSLLNPARAAIRAFAATLLIAAGCSYSSDDQRARDEVAQATERAKPITEEAGRKLDEAARDVAHEAGATARGVHDGWNNGQRSLVNVNSATEGQLLELPGIDKLQARKIMDNRPYAGKRDLVAKGAISDATYAKVRDRIVAN